MPRKKTKNINLKKKPEGEALIKKVWAHLTGALNGLTVLEKTHTSMQTFLNSKQCHLENNRSTVKLVPATRLHQGG